ncbi:protein yjbR [Klebsiella pneumoniae]|uniref:Protein yjbR n=3 Tax=Enterobacterales TaxID=91347 RepID=A0A377ZQ34_KLEPN|nr:protein yjbR [Klebsiella pneumoniae]
MPSHIKSSMLGVSLMLPVEDGRVRLGTWQGIWLGEHRIHGGSRRIVATLMGNKDDNFGVITVLHGETGSRAEVHSDWKATQIKVSDVLFAMVKEVEEQRPAVALKASPELAELLRQQHRDVRPSQHLNKAHWSTVYLDGSLPDSQIYYLVDASYQQAVKMLPEPVRQQLTR